jgi:transposase InsO family protein
MALWRRQVEPGELVHHSDRGSQYTSFACGRTLGRVPQSGVNPGA